MKIEIQLTTTPIVPPDPAREFSGSAGAYAEFSGRVRGLENGAAISALEYEAYSPMAENEMHRILAGLAAAHPCLAVKVIHRIGVVPVGETAIYVGIAARHREEAFALLAEFMNRLKRDVPVWKRRALPETRPGGGPTAAGHSAALLSLDDALAGINSHCQPLAGIRVSLDKAIGRVLRETVCATEDLPSCDCSTRDGCAVLLDDDSQTYQVVDTLHAGDWRPRQLRNGEAVRVATGAALPCGGLRVVMQEHVERAGREIKITRREAALNIRRHGEDMKAGQPLVPAGVRLDAGRLALLATAGCATPLVGPRLRVVHFTTGDELVPPAQTPGPGRIRDSNSIMIRALLEQSGSEMRQAHLPEDFEKARAVAGRLKAELDGANLVLVSGGASVGEKDFTRPMLEWLGFKMVFSQVDVRPGRPLIFGVNGNRIAFGLPGNPLSHFACFHLFVAAALAKLTGARPGQFLRGRLAAGLEDAVNTRETLWPARRDATGLHPLVWASSGDVTCLAETNALIRVPANVGSLAAGTEVGFWPTDF